MNLPGTAADSFSSGFGPVDSSHPCLVKSSSLSLDDPATPSTRPPFKPHEILYPEHRKESLLTGQVGGARVGLTPLDMIQKIVSMAEVTADFNTLSESSERLQLGRSSLHNFLTDHSSSIDLHAGQKRKRDYNDDEDCGDSFKSDSLVEASLECPGNVLQGLTKMVSVEEHDSQSPSLSVYSNTVAPVLSSHLSKDGPLEKKDFQYYMQLWLRANWQNPFPDDSMLNHLANYLIQERCVPLNKNDVKALESKTSTFVEIAVPKITNWLVNTRTRKWRPCIERAFDKKRPAAILFQDSLRIYEEKELRPLVGWDGDSLFSFDSRYSAPLRTWKKKGRAVTSGAAKGGNKKKTEANPLAVLDETTDAPLDISPCSAFDRACGEMILEGDNDFLEDHECLGGDLAAI